MSVNENRPFWCHQNTPTFSLHGLFPIVKCRDRRVKGCWDWGVISRQRPVRAVYTSALQKTISNVWSSQAICSLSWHPKKSTFWTIHKGKRHESVNLAKGLWNLPGMSRFLTHTSCHVCKIIPSGETDTRLLWIIEQQIKPSEIRRTKSCGKSGRVHLEKYRIENTDREIKRPLNSQTTRSNMTLWIVGFARSADCLESDRLNKVNPFLHIRFATFYFHRV
jgi:hypothetical protein